MIRRLLGHKEAASKLAAAIAKRLSEKEVDGVQPVNLEPEMNGPVLVFEYGLKGCISV